MVVNKTDIAIIGGGIQGVMLAYYAKKRYPERSVSLYESTLVGIGITAYSAHLHIPYGKGDKHALTRQSMSLYEELCSVYDNFPLVKMELRGICQKKSAQLICADLTEKHFVSDDSPYPFCKLSKEHLHISGLTCYVTKRNLVSYLMELIIQLGVKVYEGINIVLITRKDNVLYLLQHTGETIQADYVFSCTGKELVKIFQGKGMYIRTKKVLALHLAAPVPLNAPVYYYFDDDAFLLPQPWHGGYLFSFCCDEWNVDSSKVMLNSNDLATGKKILNRYAKDLSSMVCGGQAYLDVYNNPSTSPLIYELERNHYLIGASGGSGVRLAPALAVKALNCISGEII